MNRQINSFNPRLAGGAPDLSPSGYAGIDAYVISQMRRLNLPGIALGIVSGDRIVHLRGFGRARPGGGAPSPQTPFFIGSLTKSFTALGVMQLAEAGKVGLDAPVERYLPWFRARLKGSGEPARLVWEREPVRMSADDALAAENRVDKSRPGPEPDAQNAAGEWLADLLCKGSVPSGNEVNPEPGTVRYEAKQAGLSWATVRRAADKLGVRREKSAFSGGWQWRLPKVLTEDAQQPQGQENLSNLDTLGSAPARAAIPEPGNIQGAQDDCLGQVGQMDATCTK